MQISAIPVSAPVVPTATEPTAINPATDPVTPAEPTTPTVAPAAPPSKFLQKLASGHFNPVAALRHRMRLDQAIKDSGLTMPELAAPANRGKAYEKFLAAYRAMSPAPTPVPTNPTTVPATTTEPASPAPVNVEA